MLTVHPYIDTVVPSISALFLTVALSVAARAEESSSNSPQIKQLLQVCPEADANKDGVLTRSEAEAYVKAHPETLAKLKRGGAAEEKTPTPSKPQGASPAQKEVVPVQPVTANSDEPAWMPYIRVRDGFQWTAPGAPKADKFDTKRYSLTTGVYISGGRTP